MAESSSANACAGVRVQTSSMRFAQSFFDSDRTAVLNVRSRYSWHTDEFCALIDRHIQTAKPKIYDGYT